MLDRREFHITVCWFWNIIWCSELSDSFCNWCKLCVWNVSVLGLYNRIVHTSVQVNCFP